MRAGDRQVVERGEQRLVAFAERGRFGRPVVHLGVDVAGVLAVPRRTQLVVPDALQVGRLAARAAGADQQVAAVLEDQRGQVRIVAVGELGDALVGRLVGGRRAAEVERHAAEQRLVIGEVRGRELLPRLAGRRLAAIAAQRSAGSAVMSRKFLKFVAATSRMISVFAPATRSPSCSAVTVPPSAAIAARLSNRMPSASTWPRKTSVWLPSTVVCESWCGLVRRTTQSSLPGLSAVIRTQTAWSGCEANTSRR